MPVRPTVQSFRSFLAAPFVWWAREASTKDRLEQTAWERGQVDAISAAKDGRLFGLFATVTTCAAPTAVGFATTHLSIGFQLVLIVVAAVGGYLLVPTLWAVVASIAAPTRQRNEARKGIERLTAELEPDTQLFNDFDAFLIAARAKEPHEIRTSANIFEKEGFQQIVRVQNDYKSSLQEWWRETIGEYHERFRARVLLALKDTNEADAASDPKSFRDLERIDLELNYLDCKSGPGP